MTRPKDKSKKLTDLRHKAEQKLKTQMERLKKLSTSDTRHLVQELGTHQIELEMEIEELQRAQEELEASRSKYSDLYDFSPVGYLTFDRAGVIEEVNLTSSRLLGIERRSLLGKPFSTVVHKDDRDAFHLHCSMVAQEHAKQTIEIRIKHRDKTDFSALLESIAVEDHDGKVVAIRTAMSDITERVRAEAALKESELRYRSLIENMMDGYAYCRMVYDKNGRPADFVYVSVNSAFEQLTGLKDVVGRKVTDVIPGIRASHPQLLETYGRVAATGRPERFEIEFEPLNMWLSISVYSTERDHFTAVFDNITERKRAEEELRQSEERMQLALRVSRSFTFDWHPADDTVVRSASCADILQLSGDEAIHDSGKRYFERVHPDDRGRFLQVLQGLRPGADNYIVEYRILRGDGSEAVLEEMARAMFDATGRLTRLTGVSTDITERKRAMEELAERNKELMRFNQAAVDRELRMIELKQEINKACAESGKPPRYRVDFDKDQET